MTTFTNGQITLTQDLVFGACVLTESGYYPINQLTIGEAKFVLTLIGGNTTCPKSFINALRTVIDKQPSETNMR